MTGNKVKTGKSNGFKKKLHKITSHCTNVQHISSSKKEKLEVPGSKSKKTDVTKSELQLLESVFQTRIIPEPENITELSQKTGLSAQEVKNWFVKKLNEESKKRFNPNPTGSYGKESPRGKETKMESKVKVIDSFKDMTKDHKIALEDIFKANQDPSDEMLTEVSSKLKIDLNLLTKWFTLRGQQKKKRVQRK